MGLHQRDAAGRGLESVAVATLCVFFALLGFEFLGDTFSALRGGDNASYVLLAKAIASGAGYVDINVPGSPPHAQYPPLFPVMLSPIVAFFGYNFLLMRAVVVASMLAALYLTARIVERECGSRRVAMVMVLLTGTNFSLGFFAREVLPEVPYLFVSLLAIICLERFARPEGARGLLWPLALMAPLAYFTKFAGVVLCAAVVAVIIIRMREGKLTAPEARRRLLIFLIIGVLPFVLWMARNSLVAHGGDGATYQSILARADYYDAGAGTAGAVAILKRAWANLGLYSSAMPGAMLTYLETSGLFSKTLVAVVAWIVLLISLLGLGWRLRRARSIMDFYVLFYLAVLVVWPVYGMGDARRYMVPITPFIYFYFFIGLALSARLRALVRKGDWRPSLSLRSTAVPALFLLFLNIALLRDFVLPHGAAGKLIEAGRAVADGAFERVEQIEAERVSTKGVVSAFPCWAEMTAFAVYMRGELPPGAIIMARKPEIVSLLCERRAVRFPFTEEPGAMAGFIGEMKVTHVIEDACYPETRRFVSPWLADAGAELVYSGEAGTKVYALPLAQGR